MAPRTHWLIAVSALLPLAFQQPAAAQDAARAYAQGVQAYFNGGASRAEGLLDQAAGLNPRDPLVYYFRGLAKLRQGRRLEAIEDFRIGATFEAKRPSGSLGIGRTLERVQGGNRLLLEQIRRETREGYEIAVVEEEQTRYQPTRDRGERALRSDFRLPLSMLAADSHPDALANLVAEQAESAGDPFADEPAAPAGTDTDAAASAEALPAPTGGAPQTPIEVPDAARGAVSTKELGGIFGGMIKSLLPKNPLPAGGPFEAAPPAGDDPFGAQPAESDPFGAEPAEDDPFGAPAAEDNPFDSAPADGPAAPVEDDPFGAEPVPPAADTSEPAADPFGDAGDDPFGGADDEDPFGGEDPF